MTRFTAQELHVDPSIAKPGQYLRFDAFGRRLLEVTDSITNGLGQTFRAEADGTFTKVVF